MKVRVVLAVTVVLAASSCTSREVALPAHALPAAVAGDATGGRVLLAGRCVYLESDDGSARANLLWPPGYAATGPPLTIRDPGGTTVIEEGDEVVLGVAQVAGTAVPGCPSRPVWAIGEIAQVNGVTPRGTPTAPDRPAKPPR